MPQYLLLLFAINFHTVAHAQNGTNSAGDFHFSTYGDSFENFIAEAVRTGRTALLDRDVSVSKTIEISGRLNLMGINMPTVKHNLPVLFLLKDGDHLFQHLNIVQGAGAIAFYTLPKNNIIWNNTLRSVNVTGGRQAYSSSRGGIYDESIDAVKTWCGTTIEDAVFKTSYVCVNLFSQDGPAKFLHMRNVDLYSDTAHNLYVHPNVSLRFYNVNSMKVNTPGLAIHHYSGGGGVGGKGVESNARYVEIKRCTTSWTPVMKGGMWQLAEPVTGIVIMDSCDIAPYSIPLPYMMATNTRFFNAGSGAFVKGRLINCSGTVFPADGTTIEYGRFDEMDLRNGGKILVKNTSIKNVFGDKQPVNIVFENTTIDGMNISNPRPSKVLLKKGSKVKKYLWGWKPEAGLLVVDK